MSQQPLLIQCVRWLTHEMCFELDEHGNWVNLELERELNAKAGQRLAAVPASVFAESATLTAFQAAVRGLIDRARQRATRR